MKGLPVIVSLGIALAAWWACSLAFGHMLIPSPVAVGRELAGLCLRPGTWLTVAVTVARGMAGLLAALGCALVFGIAAGSSRETMRLLTPLVAALQSCPPILWITLLMVWAGTGSLVPMAVVFATVFPPLFANIAQGCMALDKRLFDMARLYRVPRTRVLLKIILPGLTPYLLAGLSHAAATSWKVTAVAEFLGSSTGIGARLFWSYRMLEIPQLFAWASIVVLLGVALELLVIAPLRASSEAFTGKVREQA
ncbi:ABC transporter permease [Salidesulfovibrio onnuriiensis]|uniref:ABC transporter permease n=1 Tax=Salidesulfovibrio onnuriiensis TaxID=2583823 RepID=UPI0011CAA530|nr:ABC transporter permease subunit [Salidesulfovibrio onnuriiensis]